MHQIEQTRTVANGDRAPFAMLTIALAIALPAAVAAQPCGTPGRDGSGTISGIVNTYYPGTANAAAGATSISVGSPQGASTAIAAGDLLLVIQMQDADINSNNTDAYGAGGTSGAGASAVNSTGKLEYVTATGPVASGSVPILAGGNGGVLVNSYVTGAWADGNGTSGGHGQRTFQVIRVPQYGSPTLSASTALTALGWNGSVGGVLVIDVDGTLKLNGGTAIVDSLGFRGGGGQTVGGSNGNNFANTDYRRISTVQFDGSKGEGIAGTPRYVYNGATETDNGATNEGYPNGSWGRGAPGNAGGGGTDGDNSGSGDTTNEDNCGGGGGGNGGAGGQGGECWNTDVTSGGIGGAAFTASRTPATVVMGGGAGAGDSNNAGPGHGGPGGGIIVIRTNAVSGTGTLSANGVKPCTATATCTNVNGSGQTGSTQDAAGGGGAGGSVLVDVNTTKPPGGDSTTGLTIDADGGDGGDVNWPDTDPHGPGGGGGGGRIFLSVTGATTSVAKGAHGAAGNPTTDDTQFGSQDGANGSTTTGAITFTGARPGYTCVVSQAVTSAFRVLPLDGGLVVEWETASQVGTAGFYLLRLDPATGAWLRLNDVLLPAAIESPQGAVYRFRDATASPFERHSYSLVEVEAGGKQRRYGPYTVATDWAAGRPAPLAGDYARAAHPPTATAGADDGADTATAGAARTLAATAAAGAATTTAQAAATAASRAAGAPAAAAPIVVQATKSTASELKLYVATPGIYGLSAAAIAGALGVPVATVTQAISQHTLNLTNQGVAIPWHSGAQDTEISFLGQGPPTVFTAQNVYWLILGQAGAVMHTVQGSPPTPTNAALPYPANLHFEQDLFAGVSLDLDPQSDYWYWAAVISGDPSYGTVSFPLTVQGVAGAGTAALAVHLQGASDSGVPGEHHLQFQLNGTAIGQTSWQGMTAQTATLYFPATLLQEGANTVQVTGVLDPGVPTSVTYTQSFDLSYLRLPAGDGSPVTVTSVSQVPVTVSGFASTDLAVYDVTDPAAPEELGALTVDGAGGTQRVTFAPAASGRTYLALDVAAMPAPAIAVWQPPAQLLRAGSNHASHLVITDAAAASAAAPLAAFRQAQGLASQVVTVEQIYDEFNNGLPSPLAIQSFLAYAASSWSKPPVDVVLAGDGNYDFRNYLGLGGNLVPPLMIATPDGLYAADSQYVAFPQGSAMTVGRLPATSPQELSGMIAKLIAYESAGAGAWQQQVLLAADVPDTGGEFEWESNLADALVPPPFAATKIYIAELTPDVAHQTLIDDLQSGAYVLNYIGHSGLDRFSSDALLTTPDAAALTNGARLPVVAAASCILGRFEIPGFQPLAAALLANPAGGAVAVWAPSGLTYSAQTATLDRALLPYLLTTQASTLGTAILQGNKAFSAAGGSAATLATYNLFGDPATRLQKPK